MAGAVGGRGVDGRVQLERALIRQKGTGLNYFQ